MGLGRDCELELRGLCCVVEFLAAMLAEGEASFRFMFSAKPIFFPMTVGLVPRRFNFFLWLESDPGGLDFF